MRTTGWKLTTAVLTIACVGGGAVAYRTIRPTAKTSTVRTVTAAKGTVTEIVSGTGSVEAGSTRSINLSTSGELLELAVGIGDWVEEGTVIARVDPTNAQNDLTAAESQLRQANAKLQVVQDGLTDTERKQLQLSVATSLAAIDQAKASVAAAKESAKVNEKSYSATIESAKRNVTDSSATSGINSDLETNQLANAQASIDAARRAIDTNSRTYQTQIDTAQNALNNAKASADTNAKSYQAAVDAAETNSKNTKTNIELSNASAQAQAQQADAQLAILNTALGQAQADLSTAQTAYLTAQSTESAAKSALDTATSKVVPPATCDTTPACAQAQSAYQSAKTATTQAKTSVDTATTRVTSAQNSVTQQQNAITNLANSRNASSAKDEQNLAAASGPQVQNAKQAQEVGLAKDQQSIASAETAFANAKAAQAAGIEKDQASLAAAELALNNLQLNQASSAVKEKQSTASAKAAVENATTARTTGRTKDAQSVTSAQNQLRQAQQSYQQLLLSNQIKLAPAKAAELEAATSAVFNAERTVTTAQKALDGATVKAPIAGTVTALNAEVGQTVGSDSGGASGGSSSAFATITDTHNLKVKLGVSEANAAKLATELIASVTFDALPTVTASSFVTRVDAVATTSNGVATYPVYLALSDTAWQDGVKAGMTAQVRVTVKEVSDVVTLSASAIRSLGGRSIVMVYDAATKKQTPTQVTLGVKGEGGTQIVDGISEGAVIALPEVAATQNQTQNQRQTGGIGGTSGPGGGPGAFPGGGPRG